MRAELVFRVHECNVWVRCCGHNLDAVMEDYPDIMLEICPENYMYGGSDDDDGGGCSCCNCSPRYRRPPDASVPWLAACPTLAWANMRIAAIERPSLMLLLGPE